MDNLKEIYPTDIAKIIYFYYEINGEKIYHQFKDNYILKKHLKESFNIDEENLTDFSSEKFISTFDYLYYLSLDSKNGKNYLIQNERLLNIICCKYGKFNIRIIGKTNKICNYFCNFEKFIEIQQTISLSDFISIFPNISIQLAYRIEKHLDIHNSIKNLEEWKHMKSLYPIIYCENDIDIMNDIFIIDENIDAIEKMYHLIQYIKKQTYDYDKGIRKSDIYEENISIRAKELDKDKVAKYFDDKIAKGLTNLQ